MTAKMTHGTTKKAWRYPNPKKHPLDGGCGWMVVLGCSMMHLLVAGLGRSYGVIFIQLQQKFHSNAGVTAWVGGTCTALRMGLSPISTSLSNQFGARPIIFIGGLLVSLGCFVSAFTPNTEFMFFSYAILTGVGGTLAYAPSLVLVGQYFDKYRGIAVGLGCAGSGIGVFVIPPVMNTMFDYYGYMGTLLVMSAIMLNVCICGVLHRPLEANIPPEIKSTMDEDLENERNIDNVDGDLSCSPDHKEDIRSSTDTIESNVLYNRFDRNSANKYTNVPLVEREGFMGSSDTHDGKDMDAESLTVKISESSENQDQLKKGCAVSFTKYIDLSLCKDPVFLFYMFAMGFHALSYIAGQMLVPAIGQIRGHSQMSSAFLLSILGIAETIGRVSSGFIFDFPLLKCQRSIMYNVCILIAGSCHLMWAFVIPYPALTFACALHGLSNGCVVSQRTVILSDLLGVERLSSSFGLTVFMQGCGIMIGPAVAGVIRDATGDYTASYIFTFTSAMLAAVLFFLSTHKNLWYCGKQTVTI